MTAAAPATAAEKTTAKTAYHILREVTREGAATYEPVAANVEASSAAAAIRNTVKENGTYIAITSRSFTPTKVTLETQTVVKLG